MLNIISLGAGVQSTTMLLMADRGMISPKPDAAIFADTQWEPIAVYEHLRWLRSPNVCSIPIIVVSGGNLRADTLAAIGAGGRIGRRFATPPFFTRASDGIREAMLSRQCTDAYKIEPINRRLREMIGLKPRQRAPKEPRVSLWIGISTDEFHRAKPSRVPWIERRWPLIEMSMARHDCVNWLKRHGYPSAPKSACIGCPFHSDRQWRAMRTQSPLEFADAVEFDEAIRPGMRSTRGEVFLHRSLKPLRNAVLPAAAASSQPDLFGNECEGVCGV